MIAIHLDCGCGWAPAWRTSHAAAMEAVSMGKKKAKRNYRRTVLRSTVALWQFLAGEIAAADLP